MNGKGSDAACDVEILDSVLGGIVAVSLLGLEKEELSGPTLMLMEIIGLDEGHDVVPPDVGFAVSEAELGVVVDIADVVLSKAVVLKVLEDWLL